MKNDTMKKDPQQPTPLDRETKKLFARIYSEMTPLRQQESRIQGHSRLVGFLFKKTLDYLKSLGLPSIKPVQELMSHAAEELEGTDDILLPQPTCLLATQLMNQNLPRLLAIATRMEQAGASTWANVLEGVGAGERADRAGTMATAKVQSETANVESMLKKLMADVATLIQKQGEQSQQVSELRVDVRGIVQSTAPLVETVEKLGEEVRETRADTAAIAKNQYELRKENEILKTNFTVCLRRLGERVNHEDFTVLLCILAVGNRSKAAELLDKPSRTLYDRVNAWQHKGPDYQRLFRLVEWRKNVGRTETVPLPSSLVGRKERNGHDNPKTIEEMLQKQRDCDAPVADLEDLLGNIREALLNMNAKNCGATAAELLELIREVLPQ